MNAPVITTEITTTPEQLVEIADRIRARTAQAVIETGRDLIKAKKLLGHGGFGDWLRSQVGIEPKMAQRYMQVARWADSRCVAGRAWVPALCRPAREARLRRQRPAPGTLGPARLLPAQRLDRLGAGPLQRGVCGVNDGPLLNVQETCRYLRISPRHLRDLRAEGSGPPAVRLGRRLLFMKPAPDAWIEANRETGIPATTTAASCQCSSGGSDD